MNIRTINSLANGTSKFERVAAGVSLLEDAKNMVDRAVAWHKEKTTWTVRINESDANFSAIENWLMKRIPEKTLHSVVAKSVKYVKLPDGTECRYNRYREDVELYLKNPNLSTYEKFIPTVGSSQLHKDVIGGHSVVVGIYPNGSSAEEPKEQDWFTKAMTSDNSSGFGSGSTGTGRLAKAESCIIFHVRSLGARSSVLDFLNTFASEAAEKKSQIFFPDSWGEWSSSPAPKRSLNTVVVEDGVVESLKGDLQKFLADESKYTRLGIPFHRGYLLYGPPGTGKTSMVKALAAEMGLDLWYLSMGDVKDDTSLLSMINSVREGGILLLEDVDSFSPVLSREDGAEVNSGPDSGVSTAALLNALDGVATPHGLITIMTTNYIERLDTALTRSGRVDRLVALNLPSWGVVQRLWDMFYAEDFSDVEGLGPEPDWFAGSGISHADVSEVFKANWENPEAARLELSSGAFVR